MDRHFRRGKVEKCVSYARKSSKAGKASVILMSVLAQNEQEVRGDVKRVSLMHSHRMLITILQMAKNMASGIALTDACEQSV